MLQMKLGGTKIIYKHKVLNYVRKLRVVWMKTAEYCHPPS